MKEESYHLSVNGQYKVELSAEQARRLDSVAEGGPYYHLLIGETAHRAELLDTQPASRQYTFRINGSVYQVQIADDQDQLIQRLGLSAGGGLKQNTVKAPMPGLVLKVMVEPGQQVHKGDALLILEAMKMENVIKAVSDGTVKAIKTTQGAAVDKGQLLLEMA